MKITYRPLEKTDLESVFKLTSNRNVARFMRFGVAETMEEVLSGEKPGRELAVQTL